MRRTPIVWVNCSTRRRWSATNRSGPRRSISAPEAVTRVYVQTKLQFQTVLDQVFPAYRDVFESLYSQVALKVLLDFPTADAVLAVPQGELAERIAAHCPSRSARWAAEKSAHTGGGRFGRRGYRARISC